MFNQTHRSEPYDGVIIMGKTTKKKTTPGKLIEGPIIQGRLIQGQLIQGVKFQQSLIQQESFQPKAIKKVRWEFANGWIKKLKSNSNYIRGWQLILFCLMIPLFTSCRLSGSVEEITVIGEVTGKNTETTKNEGIPKDPAQTSIEPPGQHTSDPPRPIFMICEIKGHIEKPGVYDLAEGSRVSDLILRSGGVLQTGSLEFVNQARKLHDGEVVIVPAKGVTKEDYDKMAIPDSGDFANQPNSPQSTMTDTKLVNINTASQAELDTIPGVGPATALNIITYRTQVGPFGSIEDLKKVDRIGDKTFEKLKQFITVGR